MNRIVGSSLLTNIKSVVPLLSISTRCSTQPENSTSDAVGTECRRKWQCCIWSEKSIPGYSAARVHSYLLTTASNPRRRLLGCWFNCSNHGKPYYIGRYVEAVNRMVAMVKPQREFRRALKPDELLVLESFWVLFLVALLRHSHSKIIFTSWIYPSPCTACVCCINIIHSDSVSSAKLETVDRLLKTFYNDVPHLWVYFKHPQSHSYGAICQNMRSTMATLHVWVHKHEQHPQNYISWHT